MITCKNDRGATLVEFSLICGILLVVIFSLVEGARYLATMGILYSAADRAIAVAASDYRLNEAPGSSKYNQGVQAVQQKFKDSLAGSWIGLGPDQKGGGAYLDSDLTTLTAEVPNKNNCPGATSDQDALLNCPVKLTFSASMIPIVPCVGALFSPKNATDGCDSPVPIKIFAASFKEPYKALTLPTPVDCRGRVPSTPGYGTDCACDVDKYWDTALGCVCYSGQTDANGNCNCPGSWEFNNADKRCSKCSLTSASCTIPGSVFIATSCGCQCDPNKGFAADGLGGCNACADPNRKYEGGTCDSCKKANSECPGADKGTGFLDGSCTCTCDFAAKFWCGWAGKSFNDQTCSCDCGTAGDFKFNPQWGWGACECPTGDAWAPHNCPDMNGIQQRWDVSTCSCSC